MIRRKLLESHIRALRESFGTIRMPVDDDVLESLYRAKNYTGIVGFVRTALRLDMRAQSAIWYRNFPTEVGNAPAWVERPRPLPMFGTREFRDTLVTVNFRKSFLDEATFEQVVAGTAHELSHVVLDAISHVLQREEEAVDLTAMLLGFRDFYVTGNSCVETTRYGYLNHEEVRYAAHYMTFNAPPPGF